jgi:fibronectin type 3 domain-containing protein
MAFLLPGPAATVERHDNKEGKRMSVHETITKTPKRILPAALAALFVLAACQGPLDSVAVAPAAPGKPELEAGDGQISVAWNAVEGASHYEVWHGAEYDTELAQKAGFDKTGLRATVTGLSNDTAYFVWIKAKNGVGASGFSPAAEATPRFSAPPLSRPSLSAGTPATGVIRVEWSPVAKATGYDVYCATDSALPAQRYCETTETAVTIADLVPETTYWVWVRPKNTNGPGNISDPATIRAIAIRNPPAPPAAPLLMAGPGQIKAEWTAAEDADSYELWYGTEDSIAAAQQYDRAITETTATITGLANETIYYVWLRAANHDGPGEFSPPSSIKASSLPQNLLVQVLNRTTQFDTAHRGGALTVSWTPVAGAVSYEVYYAPRAGSAIPPIADAVMATTDTNSIVIEDNAIGETTMNYYVWVKAKDSDGVASEAAMTGAFDFFTGTWQPFNEAGDKYRIFNDGKLIYGMPGLEFESFVRGIVPYGERVVNGNVKAPSYVLIIEYDKDKLQGIQTTPDKYFGALYVHTAEGTGGINSRARMGGASDRENYGTSRYDCETATLDEAIARFTFDNIEKYYSLSVDIGYRKTALPALP